MPLNTSSCTCLAICMSSLQKCLFSSFSMFFSVGLYGFLILNFMMGLSFSFLQFLRARTLDNLGFSAAVFQQRVSNFRVIEKQSMRNLFLGWYGFLTNSEMLMIAASEPCWRYGWYVSHISGSVSGFLTFCLPNGGKVAALLMSHSACLPGVHTPSDFDVSHQLFYLFGAAQLWLIKLLTSPEPQSLPKTWRSQNLTLI